MDKVAKLVVEAVFRGFDTREAATLMEDTGTDYRFIRTNPNRMRISVHAPGKPRRHFVVEVREEATGG